MLFILLLYYPFGMYACTFLVEHSFGDCNDKGECSDTRPVKSLGYDSAQIAHKFGYIPRIMVNKANFGDYLASLSRKNGP